MSEIKLSPFTATRLKKLVAETGMSTDDIIGMALERLQSERFLKAREEWVERMRRENPKLLEDMEVECETLLKNSAIVLDA